MKNFKNLLLFVIVILLMLAFFLIPCEAQKNLDEITKGIVFKTTESHLYKPSNLDELPRAFEGGFLLEIGEQAIKTSGFGRFKYFIYTTEWEHVVLSSSTSGRQYESLRVYFKDPGGSIGYINLMYKEKSEEYLLTITYETEDQLWAHYMKPTHLKLYTHPEGRPSHEMRDYKTHPYTSAEWEGLFDSIKEHNQVWTDIWEELKYQYKYRDQ
jgi:hypothetical protein